MQRYSSKQAPQFKNLDWEPYVGNWLLLGPNGSGKSTLLSLLAQGKMGVDRAKVALVSHEQHREILQWEAREMAVHEYEGRVEGTYVWEYLARMELHVTDEYKRSLNLEEIWNRSLTQLSNGEMRRLLIVKALAHHPDLLLLDEPFDGLDTTARGQLSDLIRTLMQKGVRILLATHHQDEMLAEFDRVLVLQQGCEYWQGNGVDFDFSRHFPAHSFVRIDPFRSLPSVKDSVVANPKVRMQGVCIHYPDKKVLAPIHWELNAGEHYLILGNNGAGKTSFLKLISGDHPQSYGQPLWLFGRKRGTGESIWEIKRKIGWLSPDFQAQYPGWASVTEVLISGFFDTQGVYRKYQGFHERVARDWLQFLDLEEQATEPFAHLSYGQQRLVLAARAMLKEPEILILDEMCQGLDPMYRRHLLDMIDFLVARGKTQVMFCSHYALEKPKCLNRLMRFVPGQEGEEIVVNLME